VATNGCKRDIVRDGAIATGVPHPLMGDGGSLGTVESRRATRRCLIPRGTASPDAVPQLRGGPKPSPAQASDASVETLLNLGLAADTGKSPLTSRSYPTPQPPLLFRYGHKF